VSDLRGDIRRAYEARAALHEDPKLEAFRLFHGYSEGLPGLEIDVFGDTAIITAKGADADNFAAAGPVLQELGYSCIIAKTRGKAPVALFGDLPDQAEVVVEDGLRYSIEAWAPLNPGLYLDARPARQWLRQNSEGRHLLNLFSFAGSLGVAAMAGGASSVTHVDTQKRALKRCEANHMLNGQRVDKRDLVREEVLRFLKRAGQGKRRYGGVIVDPPPVGSGGRQEGPLSPIGLAAPCAALVAPEGWLLFFFHHDERSWDELEARVCESAACSLRSIWRGRSGEDFPEVDERRALRLSAFAVD
jgi:23S rRNA (cytosine1962-C5)-methyltransferase